MENLKTMFANTFHEMDPWVVFHKNRWSIIHAAVCTIKMEYCTKNNIKFINPKQQEGKLFNIFIFYIHGFFCIIIFMLVLFILWFFCGDYLILLFILFYTNIMLLMILILTLWILYLCGILILLIQEADRAEVGYVSLWEDQYSRAMFLHLFNLCYHIVGRPSEVSLSIFDDVIMETIYVVPDVVIWTVNWLHYLNYELITRTSSTCH